MNAFVSQVGGIEKKAWNIGDMINSWRYDNPIFNTTDRMQNLATQAASGDKSAQELLGSINAYKNSPSGNLGDMWNSITSGPAEMKRLKEWSAVNPAAKAKLDSINTWRSSAQSTGARLGLGDFGGAMPEELKKSPVLRRYVDLGSSNEAASTPSAATQPGNSAAQPQAVTGVPPLLARPPEQPVAAQQPAQQQPQPSQLQSAPNGATQAQQAFRALEDQVRGVQTFVGAKPQGEGWTAVGAHNGVPVWEKSNRPQQSVAPPAPAPQAAPTPAPQAAAPVAKPMAAAQQTQNAAHNSARFAAPRSNPAYGNLGMTRPRFASHRRM